MINKKRFLGRTPDVLGDKDAVHVAIVSVRAGQPINPGQRCNMNEHGEAVAANNKGLGVADPFLTGTILKGKYFWLLIDNRQISEVRHEWDHPKQEFNPPTRDVVQNETLLEVANLCKIPYDYLIEDLLSFVEDYEAVEYRGSLTTEQELEEAIEKAEEEYLLDDVWYYFTKETGYEFDNIGTECCPEYDYPSFYDLWKFPENRLDIIES